MKPLIVWAILIKYGVLVGWTFVSPMPSHAAPLWVSYVQYTLLFLACVGLFFWFSRMQGEVVQRGFFWLGLLGILTSTTALWHPLSDDVNRYLWEGYVAAKGYNPYIRSPEALSRSAPDLQDVSFYDGINHKDKTAIYGGAYLMGMRLCYGIASFLHVAWAYEWIYRFMVFLAASYVCLGVVWLCRSKSLPLPWQSASGGSLRQGLACLFLFNPLWTHTTVGEGHLDVFWIALLLTAWGLAQVRERSRSPYLACARDVLIGLSFFLAFHVKITACLFLPFLLSGSLRRMGIVALMGLMSLALYLPYTSASYTVAPFVQSLHMFATEMSYNASPLHAFVTSLFGNEVTYWLVYGLVVMVPLVCFHSYLFRSCLWAWFWWLLWSPTVHAWYLSALLVVNVFVHVRTVWVWSFAMGIMLVTHHHFKTTGLWIAHPWASQIMYMILIAVFVWEAWKYRFCMKRKALSHTNLCVIIPTLQEGERLPVCLEALRESVYFLQSQGASSVGMEVLISDGGSTDGTEAFLQNHPFLDDKRTVPIRFLRGEMGRGFQIRRAAKETSCNVLVVLHADTRLHKEVLFKVADAFRKDPTLVGLAFLTRHDTSKHATVFMPFLRWLNAIRLIFSGISFGDQIQCFRRDALEGAGGFPKQKLFEDVEVSLRMKSVGRLRWASQGGMVSMRHWRRKGSRRRRFTQLLGLCLGYMVLRHLGIDRQAEGLYHLYYHRFTAAKDV